MILTNSEKGPGRILSSGNPAGSGFCEFVQGPIIVEMVKSIDDRSCPEYTGSFMIKKVTGASRGPSGKKGKKESAGKVKLSYDIVSAAEIRILPDTSGVIEETDTLIVLKCTSLPKSKMKLTLNSSKTLTFDLILLPFGVCDHIS